MRKIRPKGYWTLERTLEECRNLVDETGNLPPYGKLLKLGQSSLAAAIINYGGVYEVRKLLKIEDKAYKAKANFWTAKKTLKAGKKLIKQYKEIPPRTRLREIESEDANFKGISVAIRDNFGGLNAFRDSLKSKRRRKSWTEENILEKCRIIIDEVGDLPSNRKLYKLGYADMATQISRKGGYGYFRKLLGLNIPQIRTESQLVDFLQENPQASAIGALASVAESTNDIADILVKLWPDRFPSAVQLSRSLPGAIKHIGHSLHPFSLEKARGFYDDVYAIPTEVKYVLDDIIYTIAVDQYQLPFNKDPEKALQELDKFASEKNGVSKLAQRVLDYYSQVYDFTIPGHGGLREAV